jgi:hypothetical protein
VEWVALDRVRPVFLQSRQPVLLVHALLLVEKLFDAVSGINAFGQCGATNAMRT